MTNFETLTTFSGSPTERIKFDGLYNNEYAMMNYRQEEEVKGVIHYHTYHYITHEIVMHEQILDGLYKNEEKNPNDVILQKRIYDKENYLREFKRANKAFTILHHEQRMEWARLNLERMEQERMEQERMEQERVEQERHVNNSKKNKDISIKKEYYKKPMQTAQEQNKRKYITEYEEYYMNQVLYYIKSEEDGGINNNTLVDNFIEWYDYSLTHTEKDSIYRYSPGDLIHDTVAQYVFDNLSKEQVNEAIRLIGKKTAIKCMEQWFGEDRMELMKEEWKQQKKEKSENAWLLTFVMPELSEVTNINWMMHRLQEAKKI